MSLKNKNFKIQFRGLGRIYASYKIVFLILAILLPLVYVAAIFYYYAWQIEISVEPYSKKVSVDSELYKSVMDNIKKREENFAQEEGKTYINPFIK